MSPTIWALLSALGMIFAGVGAHADQPEAPEAQAAASTARPAMDARAIDLLKAMSGRLAAARSLSFTAVVSYESPSRLGPPLVYTTKSDVLVQRPDKLRVLTLGDGPASEFYYDGKIMVAFAPVENLAATAEAPSSIDEALKASFDSHGTYFPFVDVIVADPYADMADGMQQAFYMGQSRIVGGTTTDMVGIVTNGVFEQIWIGAEDKLPRRLRAVYLDDPAQLRHDMELSNWKVNPAAPAGAFASKKAAKAHSMPFVHPDSPWVPAPLTKPESP